MCKYLSSAKKFIPAGDESKPSPHQAKGSFGIASGRECQHKTIQIFCPNRTMISKNRKNKKSINREIKK